MTTHDDLTTRIQLETAQIRWHELQRFFASGNAIAVDASLDLIQVATDIVADNAPQIKQWMSENRVDAVKDSQAQQWHQQNTLLWAVVIKPWVLVQDKPNTNAEQPL